jgi:hypothetical protein
MDMWSDPNLSPFMAVAAHWIEGVEEEQWDKVEPQVAI